MEKRIFISHSSKDHETAEIICNALESNGMKCWIAPRDIPYGKEWAGEISNAISESCAFLFLSSSNSNASGQVSREIQLAIQNEVPIIPIRLDDAEYSATNKYYLATIHCMFQYDASKIAKLVSDIVKAVPEKEPEQQDDVTEEKVKVKVKKERKPRYGLKFALSCLWLCLCSATAVGVFFFTDFSQTIKYAVIGAAVVLSLIPLVVTYIKAVRSYKINKKTAWIAIVLSVVAAIGIGVAGKALDNYLWYSDMENKYHIVLSAPENMTAAEFDFAAQTVEKRMDIIADGQKYTMDVDADKIELIVPYEIFGELTATDMVKCYISRAMKLYLTTNLWREEAPEPAQIEVTADDIVSLNLIQGKIPGEPEVSEEDVLDTENYEYIEVTLKEEFVKANKSVLDEYGDKIVFAQDKVELPDGYYYFNTFTSDKDNVFYILNSDRHPTLNDVLIHNMTTEHLEDSLNVKIDIAALWEKESEDVVFGKNQCDASSLKNGTITVKYGTSTYSTISEGEWIDTVKQFKNRMDALGQPYAFGYGVNEPNSIIVKTYAENLSEGLISMLCASSLEIRGGYSAMSIPVSYSGEKAVEIITADGVPALKVIAPDEQSKKLFGNIYIATEQAERNKIFIVDSNTDVPLLCAEVKADAKTDEIIFDCGFDMESQKLTEETAWVAELALAIYENHLSTYLTFESYEFSSEDMSFGLVHLSEDIRTKIEAAAPVTFIEEKGSNLRIGLDLPVDEKLPEKAVEVAKQIYEAVDFENSAFSTVSIYLIREQGEERARIFFNKWVKNIYSYQDELETGYVYAYGIFKGGRIERDRQVFLDLIVKDEFFKELNHSDDGNLFFE